MPDGSKWKATLLIQLPDAGERRRELPQLQRGCAPHLRGYAEPPSAHPAAFRELLGMLAFAQGRLDGAPALLSLQVPCSADAPPVH